MKRACKLCGKTMTVLPGRAAGQRGYFCCWDHYAQWRKGKSFYKARPDVDSTQLAKEYEAGSTLQEIASRYGMRKSGVAYRLKQIGVDRRQRWLPKPLSPEMRARVTAAQPRGPNHSHYIVLPIDKIRADYESGMSTQKLAVKYKVSSHAINERLKPLGILRPRGFGTYNKKCADGHIVQSYLELRVHDWLVANNLEHTMRPQCPWNKKAHADFKVGDYLIEVWGIEGLATYDANRIAKTAKYRECGAKLIELFPRNIFYEDFSPLEVLWQQGKW